MGHRKTQKVAKTITLPLVPLRDVVVFPHMIVPLFVGREKSIRALEEVLRNENQQIFLVTQKNPTQDDPGKKDIYTVGTIGNVLQLLKLPDGTVKVLIEGTQRGKLQRFVDQEGFYQVVVEPIIDDLGNAQEIEALQRSVLEVFEQYIKLHKKVSPDVLVSISQVDDSAKFTDLVATHLNLRLADKQALLEINGIAGRLERIYGFIEGEIDVLQAERRVRGRVKRQMEKTQREYYLNEQLKAIQKELGDSSGEGRDEIAELESKISKLKAPKEVKERATAELKKLRVMSPMSAEATVVRNYLDWITQLPWAKYSKLQKNVTESEKILDEDHYGLGKVKERISEYLAVQSRVDQVNGPILCLVGPPGVGKTSLGKSIARATNRPFVRISVGGVRDEAEIRGHRRTYIGSMPGKILQALKRAGVNNPLILLDEIDKMGNDWRGDPAAALLEVLDPEQNSTFNDHYLELDYDLSDIMFVTTANSMRMPQPLLDRMEVIRIHGYTEDEKVEICRRHLLPKQMKNHGLKDNEFELPEPQLRYLIQQYTREAGVRNLERELANLARKAVREISVAKTKSIKVDDEKLRAYAGIPKYRFGEVSAVDLVGVTTGLAWTEVGGELLSIEAVVVPGKGKMLITGKLGDVMQESIQAAASYVRSRCLTFGIIPPVFEKRDIHIHVPEGATPKDGPSAGVAMCTSIVSALTGTPVRSNVAMTGEITLRGRVLEIGGLKEKLLAAHRGGIKKVLIPRDNEKDLEEIPANVRGALEIVCVETVDEVLEHALAGKLSPVRWDEESLTPSKSQPVSSTTTTSH
jgi:ATP-dependent Lon protease